MTPTPSAQRCSSWRYPGDTDVLAWLAEEPDYIVPTLYLLDRPPTPEAIARHWIEDLEHGSEERVERAREALAAYEIVSIPLTLSVPGTAEERTEPFYLLRKRDLGLRPRLELDVTGREVRVNASNRIGHRQMANLRVQLELADGSTWSLRPTGRFDSVATLARTNLLIYPTGGRSIALASFTLPPAAPGAGPRRLRAVLVNPGSRDERDFWNVSDEVEREL